MGSLCIPVTITIPPQCVLGAFTTTLFNVVKHYLIAIQAPKTHCKHTFCFALVYAKFWGMEKKNSSWYAYHSISMCLFSLHLFVPVYVPLCLSEALCFVNPLPGTVEAEKKTGWNTPPFQHSHSTCVLTRGIWSGFRVSLFTIWYQRMIPAMAEHARLHGMD